ncbi:MAG: 23S rRNA (guanosine(2251)-2'-O)-methyltransferase RlmB [Candidatus Abyssobacteria bacterium SURF_17]|jgi:23S rRNA (guanosine2251-2'-O)-methyltransferase|uniref:23S rRNA (Guanosine(2251)-2'-O)-methyltransferase RlmB n=1 Tax=Candidatus Abyssobacteria bacterium SURF_17 TaxID=2093361 RepID=A0A419EPE8_9BACT|nr:MAG: 23S rRNA (guanosine(2251)-2'-O)-methyltransferase RlmB [Candidatus Abyssubacteria bacterium SURF_17]
MDESGYIYGRRAVLEVLRSAPGRVNKLFIAEGSRGRTTDEIRELARHSRVVTKFLPRHALERLAPGAAHQGVVASVSPVAYADAEELMSPVHKGKPTLIVMLDEITDPQNFGAILRTVEAVGAAGVIIPRHRSVGLSPVVAKHSAGASEYVSVARAGNLAMLVDQLKDNGVQVVATSGDAETSIYEVDFTLPTAVVVGSEGAGVRQIIRRKCSVTARIPMLGKIASLNASAAAAVVLYEALRQRTGAETRSITTNPP